MLMTSLSNPRVSVVLSVYNGASYLRPAIDSILTQTFTDFELLIVDDASTDDSAEIVESYTDPRIIVIRNEVNQGLAVSLNRALDSACGTYVARMDADDVSLPTRLATQVAFLDTHPEVVLVGSFARMLPSGVLMRQPLTHEMLAPHLLFHTSFIHPTVMMRRIFLNEHHLRYDPSFRQTQDYELFTRIARLGKVANIPTILLFYREHDKQASHEKITNQMQNARTIIQRECGSLGLTLSEEELDLVVAIKRYRLASIPDALTKVASLFLRIVDANEKTHRYTSHALCATLGDIWLESAISLSRSGCEVRSAFIRGKPRAWVALTPRNILRICRLLTVAHPPRK